MKQITVFEFIIITVLIGTIPYLLGLSIFIYKLNKWKLKKINIFILSILHFFCSIFITCMLWIFCPFLAKMSATIGSNILLQIQACLAECLSIIMFLFVVKKYKS